MATSLRAPAIACIGVIGSSNNPLHISLFPPDKRDALEFSFVLSSCLDIFEARIPQKTADQDFGLLQALDERLATYGWLTNTGIKFIIVIDMEGRPITANDSRINTTIGLRDSDVKPAFKALHAAYINLLKDPFYQPDQHSSIIDSNGRRRQSAEIVSKRFLSEVKRIGEGWSVGASSI